MEWNFVVILAIFVVGVILAFPLAIGICTLLGGLLVAFDLLTTRCPNCHARRKMMRSCGQLSDPKHTCKCSPMQIERYMGRITGLAMYSNVAGMN